MTQSPHPVVAGRRRLLRSLLGAAALPLVATPARADLSSVFSNPAKVLDGPLKGFADSMTRKAKGVMGPGGEAQQWLDEYLKGESQGPTEIERMARGGDAKAQTVLGYMLDNGVGAIPNQSRAVDYFVKASFKEELAQYNLGVMLIMGRGTPKDVTKAMEHFAKVKRIPYAFIHLARHALDAGNGPLALQLAERAASLRDSYGRYLQARLLLGKGENELGYRTMRDAASVNVPDAIDSMVYLLENGVGTRVEPGMAAGWWIVGEVLVRGRNIEDAEATIRNSSLSPSHQMEAIRFSRKWLLNRKPYEPFDYTRTLTYSDLARKSR